jgi:aryl-alcohol dehydrogenase-like predicted oxidoreductase
MENGHDDLGGSFQLGAWRVHRAGYGAMQLAGDGVFGPPRDRDEALRVLRAVEQTEIVCVQNLFNLANQGSADVLAECTKRKIAFVPFTPLGWPSDARNRLLASPVLTALGARLHATPGQVALAWLLDLAPNVLLIPGTRTRAHLAENLGAADVVLDDAARVELARHFPSA